MCVYISFCKRRQNTAAHENRTQTHYMPQSLAEEKNRSSFQPNKRERQTAHIFCTTQKKYDDEEGEQEEKEWKKITNFFGVGFIFHHASTRCGMCSTVYDFQNTTFKWCEKAIGMQWHDFQGTTKTNTTKKRTYILNALLQNQKWVNGKQRLFTFKPNESIWWLASRHHSAPIPCTYIIFSFFYLVYWFTRTKSHATDLCRLWNKMIACNCYAMEIWQEYMSLGDGFIANSEQIGINARNSGLIVPQSSSVGMNATYSIHFLQINHFLYSRLTGKNIHHWKYFFKRNNNYSEFASEFECYKWEFGLKSRWWWFKSSK